MNILNIFKNCGRYNPEIEPKVYIVGGAVRDIFLNRKSKDIDYLITNVKFENVSEALSHYAESVVSTDVGESMSVVKAVFDGKEYDFAIPRTEKYIGKRHTDVLVFGDPSLPVESDLSRRDFTFNAMAQDVETGEIIDPFGGKKDLEEKIICAVGNPDLRFQEDALRILRGVQFSVRFGFDFDPETWESVKRNVHLIRNITDERIYMELQKAYTTDNTRLVHLLNESGISEVLGIKPTISKNIKSLWNHFSLIYLNGGNVEKFPSEIGKLVKRWNMHTDWFEKCYKFNLKSELENIADSLNIQHKPVLDPKDLNLTPEMILKQGHPQNKIGEIQKQYSREIYESR